MREPQFCLSHLATVIDRTFLLLGMLLQNYIISRIDVGKNE